MTYRARKTEHVGAKKGKGAYWGHKGEAKRESNRARRRNDLRVVTDERALLEDTPAVSAET